MRYKFEGFDEFVNELEKKRSTIRTEMAEWAEALAFQLLEEVQREIIRTNTVDTRNLLSSFTKGEKDNVFEMREGGLSFEVGTHVEYAEWVNSGHWTINPASGISSRWVPGYWSGSRFTYDKDAKTGMLLKMKWVKGKFYWNNALKIYERMFQKSLEKKLEQWLFGGGKRR